MSLRLRLIAAFFVLSVVPVAALTFYNYRANVETLRSIAAHDVEVLAGELRQRMQVVTNQLTDRVAYLMDIASAQEVAATEAAAARSATAAQASAEASATDDVAATLSQVAMLLDNVELRDLFSGRRGGRPGGAGAPPAGARGRGNGAGARGGAIPDGVAPPRGTAPVPAGGAPAAAVSGSAPAAPSGPAAGSGRAASPGNATAAPAAGEETDASRITIDLAPIRRNIMEQYASADEWRNLSDAERRRIIGEVNQRMLGIRMGIQMGTAEIQKRVEEAQQAAAAKAREAAQAATSARADSQTAASPGSTRKTSTVSNGRLDVKVERDGEVVNQVNAEINLPNLLSTVFSTTRRDSGEVPFAVAKDGRIYAPSDADVARIQSLGDVARPGTPPGTTMLPEWVVVTTADPTGLGLRFGIARPVGDSLANLRRSAVRNAMIGFGFIALALIAIVPLSSRLTRDLSTLSEAVDRIAHGDYRARVPIRSHDEFGRLARAFNQMASDVEEHQRNAVEQERIKRELELGRRIQHDMLPHVPLRIGLTEIKGVSVPAREVGGDFFNYFETGNGLVAMLIGDVSGKGVGAALLMANIQASLRTRLALGQDLAALARELDVEVGSTTPDGVYATLFVALLDLNTHDLRYVNAGHHSQYVLRPTGAIDRMASTGLPIGLMVGRDYVERQVRVEPGDVLFFYTDGCVEVENEQEDMFGNERLEAALAAAAAQRVDDVLAHVEAEVTRFRGRIEPFDDATMMAVRVG